MRERERERERGKDWNGKKYQDKQWSVQVVDDARDYGIEAFLMET